MNAEILKCGLIAAIAWIVGYFGTLIVGQGMSAIYAYALLVGWWLAAYISLAYSLPLLSALPLALVYFAMFLFAAISQQSWFYSDVSSLSLLPLLLIGLGQSFLIASPVMFSWLFNFVISIKRPPNPK